MTFPGQITVPLMKDVKRQSPNAICELTPGTVNRHVIVNRSIPPFDNADLRRAMALAIDRFVIALNLQTSGPDPDAILDLFYGCGSSLNWDGYCNPEVDKLIEEQSMEADEARRRQIVWQIERKLGEDAVRPIIFYTDGATCWHPYVKGVTIMVNSSFTGYRYEDVWLDK